MQPDAEHQQHDADFSQLFGDVDIGEKPRREWTDEDAGEQVTDQRRQTQTFGNESEDKAKPKSQGKRGDQRGAFMHWRSLFVSGLFDRVGCAADACRQIVWQHSLDAQA